MKFWHNNSFERDVDYAGASPTPLKLALDRQLSRTHEVKMGSKPISMIKLVLYGFLTWLIPFVVSVPLMGRDAQPILPTGIFKSLMIVVGSAVGAWLLVRVFERRPAFKSAGLIVGLLWFGINVGLDLLILLPLTKMSLPDYVGDIALRYLVIPIMAIAVSVASSTSDAGS